MLHPSNRLLLSLVAGSLCAMTAASSAPGAPRKRTPAKARASSRKPRPAHSAKALPVAVIPDGKAARLLVGGKLITTFRLPNGSLSPLQRAETAAERLRELIPAGLAASDVEIRSRGESWGVYARGGLVMVATPLEAAEREQQPKETATLWAQNLKSVLGGRGVSVAGGAKPVESAKKPEPAEEPEPDSVTLGAENRSLTVPFGETRVMSVKGSADGAINVRVEGAAASANVVPGRSAIEVKGLGVGSAVVRFGRDGKESAFTVWVKKYAGRIDGDAEAGVTGASAPGSFVRTVAAERVLDQVEREPGAVVRITGEPEGVKPIERGQSTTVAYPITITGEGLLPVRTMARVKVTNLPLPPRKPAFLVYSNDPESVREHGTLFEAPVEAQGPTRLFFHHQNRMGQGFVFEIHLVNPGVEPVDVQVIGGDAGPFIDPLQAGHRAGQKFLSALTDDLGYITRIPPKRSRVVYARTVPNKDTVSGIYSFRVVSGGPLVTLVTASQEPARPEITADMLEVARQEPHIYPTPEKVEEHSYRVGDRRWTFIPIGRKPVTGKNPQRKLFGNYGVVYNISLDVSNPTESEATVKVVFTPEANWARGVFMIDGKLIEVPQVAPPMEKILHTLKLAPGESRKISIQGIPVGGSAYPVSLVVRS